MSESFVERLVRLKKRCSQPGWKGAGSDPVLPETWDEALKIADAISAVLGNELPFISCGSDGSIALRWGRAPGRVIDVEVMPHEDPWLTTPLSDEEKEVHDAADADSGTEW